MAQATVPILAIGGVAGAGLGLTQQREASRNARRSAASTREAADVALDQSARQAQLDRLKIRSLRRRAEGRRDADDAQAPTPRGAAQNST